MRAALFFLSVFLLFGCLQHEPAANQTTPQQNQAQPFANITEASVSGNITVPPQQDQTAPPLGNETNQTNQTAPPPANQATNQSTSQQNQTANQSAPNENTVPEGLSFANDSYILVLDDVSIIPTSAEPCGIFSVRDASDASLLDKMLICPGDSENWISPDGGSYRISVVKVAAGYSGQEKWAKVTIYG